MSSEFKGIEDQIKDSAMLASKLEGVNIKVTELAVKIETMMTQLQDRRGDVKILHEKIDANTQMANDLSQTLRGENKSDQLEKRLDELEKTVKDNEIKLAKQSGGAMAVNWLATGGIGIIVVLLEIFRN